MENSRPKESVTRRDDRSRVLPLLIAGGFCFCVAVILGYGSWKLFGSGARQDVYPTQDAESLATVQTNERDPRSSSILKTNAPVTAKPETASPTAFKGTVRVKGGDTEFGGGVSQRPLKRVIVDDFLISETEVTNEEYKAFVKTTGYWAPTGWKNDSYPDGEDDLPVVNVSVEDANAFCEWKSKELEMDVRLPGYAEWQRAASGTERFKYPWGNDWIKDAVSQKESERAFAVKSFAKNRSPAGAYDMVGNVWEWTAEPLAKDEIVNKAARAMAGSSAEIHLVLGGSFKEDRKKLANSFWAEISATTRDDTIGFRYVIVLDKSHSSEN